jgi:dolichol-phosphate mannosyltransferase
VSGAPVLSVVVPVKNEAGNITPLVAEIEAACAGLAFELIYVDDGSTDGTPAALAAARAGRPWLRVLRHARSGGQSAAVRSGVLAARGAIIATLDGDGQNDPAFIPALLSALETAGPGAGLAQGQRRGRKDGRFKMLQSRIANGVRGRILKDATATPAAASRSSGVGSISACRISTPSTASCRRSSSAKASRWSTAT